jgi:hypothetical protein
MLSQFQVEPRHEHWIIAKQILRYLCGVLNYGLRYASNSDIQLHGFTDSDWVESAYDRNNTSSIFFSLVFSMILWASRKHKFVALNTAEVEYIAACDACIEEVWLCNLVSGLFDHVLDSTVIYCDDQSSVKLLDNPMFHDRSKRIEIFSS